MVSRDAVNAQVEGSSGSWRLAIPGVPTAPLPRRGDERGAKKRGTSVLPQRPGRPQGHSLLTLVPPLSHFS